MWSNMSTTSDSIKCNECGEFFSSRNKLFKHVRNFHKEKVFSSTTCSSSISSTSGATCKEKGSTDEREDITIVYSDPWLVLQQGIMCSTGIIHSCRVGYL